MLSVFGDLKHLVRYKKSLINNSTFKLHYKFSFTILCIFSVIQGLNQHLGDPILCQEIQNLPKEMVNTFCWIHGTYIVQDSEVKDNFNGLGTVTKDTPTRNQYWYQWVIFVVFLQAVLCYLPHYLWKIWEGNKISLLIQDLDRPTLDTEGEETREKRRSIVSYLYRASKTHNVYVSKFVFCEFLNLANVIGQLYFMNFFFDGTFFDFGLKVIRSETQEETVQKMSNVFPKIAKCNLTDYGPSGTIQRKDTWCVLPMNNFNGKFYIFLWFWYLAVLSWTTIFLCFRILTIASRFELEIFKNISVPQTCYFAGRSVLTFSLGEQG